MCSFALVGLRKQFHKITSWASISPNWDCKLKLYFYLISAPNILICGNTRKQTRLLLWMNLWSFPNISCNALIVKQVLYLTTLTPAFILNTICKVKHLKGHIFWLHDFLQHGSLLNHWLSVFRCGDMIVAVNGLPTAGMSHSALVPMLKEQRSRVALTVVSWPGSLA